LIKNMLLLLLSTVITLGISEVFLRYTMSEVLYPGTRGRTLYYGENTFKVEDNQAVHYRPNALIRSIAVYYNKVEYDTKHQSNNLGFLSDTDYKKEDKKGILFLGDSFTAGVGSTTPWIPKLDKHYADINLYSLGVTGTGVENFYRTYEKFENTLNYDTVVIMAISDDMTRPLWKPVEKDGWIYFDYKNKRQPIMRTIKSDVESDSLLYPEQLFLIKGYKLVKEKLLHKKEKHLNFGNMPRKPYEASYRSLEKIVKLAKQKDKRVIFVHLLEKREFHHAKYRFNLKERIEALGIEYFPIIGKYRMDLSMYHVHDGHPNDKGYQRISEIVADILGLK